jgi:hypothetical protein
MWQMININANAFFIDAANINSQILFEEVVCYGDVILKKYNS